MTCEHVKEHLSAYLDNALSFEERLSIAAHVENCQSCQSVLADFARLDALIKHLPRISPKPTLRESIFSSQEYLELIGTSAYSGTGPGSAFVRGASSLQSSRPRLTSLPGGRQAPKTPSPLLNITQDTQPIPTNRTQDTLPIPKQKQRFWRQRVFYGILAASILLTLGIGTFMSWRLQQQQEKTTLPVNAITPPAALSQQGPLPAGTRFLFLRDGSLWSRASDGSNSSAILTAKTVTVTDGWTIRPGINGHSAGNLIAYIDIRQGFVHIIRSDGQTDTPIPQVLVPAGEQTATTWQTTEGQDILKSLSWSADGSTLAFVGRNGTQKQDSLYLYQPESNSVHQIPLTAQESVSKPVWSPDSKRIAFQFTQNGAVGIAEYHLQNHETLNIVQHVNTPLYLQDTLLSLAWTADDTALTWSVGSSGHVHTIWLKQVGLATNSAPILLRTGDFAQASYNSVQNGRWLFVTLLAGRTGDIYTVGLNALLERETRGRTVSSAQWSPDGHVITYIDTLTSSSGILHQINILTHRDTLVAPGVHTTPAPRWSSNQQLAYSTDTTLYIADEQGHTHALGPQGHISIVSWSNNNPDQIIVVLSDQHAGIYLLDSHKNSVQQLDSGRTQGEIQWSEIP